MSRIRAQDTSPELTVRSVLHRAGFRFRRHGRDLPGRPDIVLKRYGVCVFVHGCYWHRHPGCWNCTTPTRNRALWMKKFAENVQRDQRNIRKLKRLGWRVAVVWECEVSDGRSMRAVLRLLADARSRAAEEQRLAIR